MSKQDVIDYVMETPHNTNRAVLEGLVDTAVEESQVQADWDQNDPAARDYIKNRPGGYYIHAPVLGISENITLHAISATSAKFYITFIGEDDDESFDKYDETLILHFFGKEIPISYNTSYGYYVVNETINGITIGVINDSYYDKKTTWSATYNIEKESILTPSDFYITKKSSVPFYNAIIPQANEDAFGALKPYCYNETDENYPYDDYQQCYQVLSSGEQNGRLTTKKQVRSYYELTPDIILNSCFYANEGDFIANFRGASDEIKNLLGVQDVDFPILMYHKDTVYNSERPTYTLSVITQTGKHGTFTCKRSTGEMTPIAWTFEGGGNSTFDIVLKYDNSTNEYTPTQTWDEIKTALTKSDRYEDYALLVDGVYMGIERFYVSRNNNGEVDSLSVQAKNTYNFHDITDINNNNIATTYTILSIDYEVHATKNKVTSKENLVAFQYNLQIVINRDDTGALTCLPKNAVAYLLSNAGANASIAAVSNEGPYSFEGAEADSNATGNMPNVLYFSTTTNGIYKRLKITQGQNGAADTVVMDKEIKLSDEPLIVDITFERGKYYSNATAGTIYNAAVSGQRVITNNGLSLMYYKKVPANPPTSGPTYSLLFFGCGNSFENKDSFQAVVISCVDKDDSFTGEWTGYYVSDLTNPLGLRNSQVGQIAEISGVDSNGKPTSWKTVDVLTTTNTAAFTPTADYHPATKKYVDDHTPSKISKLENDSNYITAAHVYDGILISSSTPNSAKKFKITVDDTGALTATEVTEA